MRVRAEHFWIPKGGSTEKEFEDAFYPLRPFGPSDLSWERRFAVADGATESAFARLWARITVRAFVQGLLDDPLNIPRLAKAQAVWERRVFKQAEALPWFVEEKARSGAFAALLGLVLNEDDGSSGAAGKWRASAVGDSCLVQLRGEDAVARFPLAASADFNNRPALLSSNPALNAEAAALFRRMDGTWQSGDSFYLMTDALACWFYQQLESGGKPWLAFGPPGRLPRKELLSWINDLRVNKEMRNDDVTLYRVTML